MTAPVAVVVPEPITVQAGELRATWWIFVIAAAVVMVVVYAVIGFTLVRYRRRDEQLPRQVHYRVVVEIGYTIVPVLIVLAFIVVNQRALGRAEAVAADPDVVVGVEASQWQWRFTYEGDGGTGTGASSEDLVLPAGAAVRFEITSADVIHSFWVPGFFYKLDAIPGRTNRFDVTVGSDAGTWPGVCAEFCGLDHADMRFDTRVVEPAEFERWMADLASGEETG